MSNSRSKSIINDYEYDTLTFLRLLFSVILIHIVIGVYLLKLRRLTRHHAKLLQYVKTLILRV